MARESSLRTRIWGVAASAVAAALWLAALPPVLAGGEPRPDAARGGSIRFEATDTGAQLKIRGRGHVDAKNPAKLRIEVESRMLAAGAALHVYAMPAPDSTETAALLGTIELTADAGTPGLVRGAMEWNPPGAGRIPALRVTNACDATLVYLVTR
jgi:hypothetical protein